MPKTDPDSRILPSKEGGFAANFTPMATTETGMGLIVDAGVVIGNVEHDQLLTTVETIQADFGVDIERMLADSAYTRGENLERSVSISQLSSTMKRPTVTVARQANRCRTESPIRLARPRNEKFIPAGTVTGARWPQSAFANQTPTGEK